MSDLRISTYTVRNVNSGERGLLPTIPFGPPLSGNVLNVLKTRTYKNRVRLSKEVFNLCNRKHHVSVDIYDMFVSIDIILCIVMFTDPYLGWGRGSCHVNTSHSSPHNNLLYIKFHWVASRIQDGNNDGDDRFNSIELFDFRSSVRDRRTNRPAYETKVPARSRVVFSNYFLGTYIFLILQLEYYLLWGRKRQGTRVRRLIEKKLTARYVFRFVSFGLSKHVISTLISMNLQMLQDFRNHNLCLM